VRSRTPVAAKIALASAESGGNRGGFAHSARIGRALDDRDIEGRHFVDAHLAIIVEVALLDAAARRHMAARVIPIASLFDYFALGSFICSSPLRSCASAPDQLMVRIWPHPWLSIATEKDDPRRAGMNRAPHTGISTGALLRIFRSYP